LVSASPGSDRKEWKNMKTIAAVSALALGLSSFGLSWAAHAAELPLRRVVLSTSGLAQFTHSGEVAPGATLDLPVRLDQVDDLLKSLTIFDSEGAIGSVSLPGKAPLAELFRDLPFGADALNSPTALLNALVGAEIEIEGQVNARGRVFRVEDERTQLPDNGGQLTRHRLTILTETGLVQAVLEELSALRFTDAVTRGQIDRAMAGLAQNRAKDRRMLSIGLLGQNTRPVGFSYVVAAPVWKTAYRLVLPKEGGKARLQGWGVVENLTGSDWKDVELSLISGNPVALRQQLYSALYVDRPEVPVVTASRIVPRRDEGGESAADRRREMRITFPASPAPQATAKASRGLQQGSGDPARFAAMEADGDAPAPTPDQISAPGLATQAEEASTQVLYSFPAKLSLAAGSTMMVPFADREITASRTWLYQPETNARRPLAAVRLQNDSETALPAGIITAFETSGGGVTNFAGDAQLPLTPKGSFKFITFALDGKTEIRREDRGTRLTRLAKIVNGEMTQTTKSRWTFDYEITAPVEEDREVVIDEARPDGWKPTAGMKDVEETATRLRYKVMASKGQTTKATLGLERLDTQIITLATLEPDDLLTTVKGLENETPAFRDAVAKLSGVVADISRAEEQRTGLEEERTKIGEDQERIRKNLQSTGQGSDLGRRYLDMLRKQEDRLAAIAEADKGLLADIAAKRKTAADMARALTL
jgi:hypothetical protein